MELVSVIVPFYNSSAFIEKAINSVFSQTYKNWELILIDDGSTDQTTELVNNLIKYEPKAILIQQQNRGQGAARNSGIKKANGNLIAFLDADDFWTADKLHLQINKKKTENADLIFSNGYLFSESNIASAVEYHWKSGIFKGIDMFRLLCKNNFLNPGTVLLNKNIFDSVGLFDENKIVRGSEDFDMWLKISRAGFLFYGMEDHLLYYRLHPLAEHTFKIRQCYGKLYSYNKYLCDQNIIRKYCLKNYRYFGRELLNELANENRFSEIKQIIQWLYVFDKFGFTTNIQFFLFKLLPPKMFFYVSNKFLYRIGYRVENLFYTQP